LIIKEIAGDKKESGKICPEKRLKEERKRCTSNLDSRLEEY
jgi:hypothetical protein